MPFQQNFKASDYCSSFPYRKYIMMRALASVREGSDYSQCVVCVDTIKYSMGYAKEDHDFIIVWVKYCWTVLRKFTHLRTQKQLNVKQVQCAVQLWCVDIGSMYRLSRRKSVKFGASCRSVKSSRLIFSIRPSVLTAFDRKRSTQRRPWNVTEWVPLHSFIRTL